MKRNAFTLIELLVVIAIIAILAAILFPVFVQAKVSAKGAASISNAKQVSTAALIYMADFEDHPPIVANFDADAPYLLLGRPYKPWAYLLLPYAKSGAIWQDPLTQRESIPPGFQPETLWTYHTQIGYAYTIHAPVNLTTTWQMQSTSQTQLKDPAETVFLTQKKARKGNGDWLWVSGGLGGPIWGANIIAPPVCSTFFTPAIIAPTSVCPPTCQNGPAGWGLGCSAYPGQTEEEGAVTGGVSLRKVKQAIVTFADGHVRTMPPGPLAAGTNWTRTTPFPNVTITDINKYLWDMQ